MNRIIDVEQLPPEDRHDFIFHCFDQTALNKSLTLCLRHDPKALYFEFLFERSGQFTWDKIQTEQGFEIKITRLRPAVSTTVKSETTDNS